jgi:hypothetical protein
MRIESSDNVAPETIEKILHGVKGGALARAARFITLGFSALGGLFLLDSPPIGPKLYWSAPHFIGSTTFHGKTLFHSNCYHCRGPIYVASAGAVSILGHCHRQRKPFQGSKRLWPRGPPLTRRPGWSGKSHQVRILFLGRVSGGSAAAHCNHLTTGGADISTSD